MAASPLTRGLVSGKTGVLLASGMGVNPILDQSTEIRDARALLRAHVSLGVRPLPPKSGARQPTNLAAGVRLTGGATIRGGSV